MWIIFAVLIFVGFVIFKWASKHFNYFKDRGIPHGKPTIIFGTGADLLLGKLSMPEFVQKWYFAFPKEKLIGLFDFRTPYFFIRDPEVAKLICIKEFNHFTDHLYTINENIDPLLGNALISLSGEKWKNMRATLSPAFTGNKMRQMFNLVNECSSTSIESLKKQVKESSDGAFEMKELFSKFTVDIIASCAFGLDVNTFENPENDFKKIAEKTMNPPNPLKVAVKFGLLYFVPKLMKFFDISLLEKHTKNFFRTTVNETMDYRERNGIIRPDMINLLMQAKKGEISSDATKENKTNQLAETEELQTGNSGQSKWTNDELVAQCLLFFLAGFDTTSTSLGFASYELALNPEMQQKLREEIEENSSDGKEISYEALMKMKYLDQFVSEVLRKWSPAPGVERYCVKDFTFELDGKSIVIEKDQTVLIPVVAWHMDPKYFPNPEKFDPDRFNDENIKKQNLAAYAPFGIGARNCIGSRFALMVVKKIVVNMLQQFSFEVNEKTQIPLKYKKTMMNVVAEKGIWLEIKNLKP